MHSIMTYFELKTNGIHMVHERSKEKAHAARKSRRARNARIKKKIVSWPKHVYDEAVDYLANSGCTAAQERGLSALIDEWDGDLVDRNGNLSEDFKFHIFMYEKIQIESKMKNESGEKLQKPEEPKIELGEPYLIESGEKLAKPEEPKIELGEPYLIESTNQKVEDMRIVPQLIEGYVHEAAMDPALTSEIQLAYKNMIPFGSILNGKFVREVYALMIAGKVGVTVWHAMRERDQFVLINGKPMLIRPTKTLKGNDLCIFEVDDKTCPAFKNIVAHLPPKRTDFKKSYHNTYGVLCTPQNDFLFARSVKLATTEMVNVDLDDGSSHEHHALTYTGVITGINHRNPILTEAGDCGSPLIANSVSIPNKIIGIHSAANQTEGCSAMLWQELFAEFLDFKHQAIVRKSWNPVHHDVPYIEKETNQYLLGMPVIAEMDEVKYVPDKSILWTSPLKVTMADTHQPAILSARDKRNPKMIDPYYKSIGLWNQKYGEVDELKFKETYLELGDWYGQKMVSSGITTKVLTKTEAINAGADFGTVQLNRDSSPGFPWYKYGKKTKNFLEKKEDKRGNAYYAINLATEAGRKLNASIDNLKEGCKRAGYYPKIPFIGSLKDEPVKMKKIEEVNTRSFAAGSLDYVILCRMMFSTIFGGLHRLRHKGTIQVGIDPASLDWHAMITDMLSVSNYGYDADFQNWDKLISPDMKKDIHLFYNRIAQMTDPDWCIEHDTIRENLCYSELYPILVLMLKGKTLFVRAPGGVPSGSQRTADENSTIHTCVHVVAVKTLLEKNGFPELATTSLILEKITKLKCYGDDGIVSVHPDFLPSINFITIEKEFTKMGLKCTPATKDGKIVSIKKVIDMEFLKRKTKKIGKYYFGALIPTSMYKMLAYCKVRPHHWDRQQDVIQFIEEDIAATALSSLNEAVLHGENYYIKMRNHFSDVFGRYEIDGPLPCYQEMIRMKALPIT